MSNKELINLTETNDHKNNYDNKNISEINSNKITSSSKIYFYREAEYLTSPKKENNEKNDNKVNNISQEKSIVESQLKKLSENDGRWEYLYQLNKFKK